ncbi:hypothetical protein R6Q57_012805 [Mikania cordata]
MQVSFFKAQEKARFVDMSWYGSNYLCLSSSSSSSLVSFDELTRFNRCNLACEDKGQRRKGYVLKKTRNISAYYSLKSPSYKFDALEPYMSQRTLEVHWGKHHRGYVESLNKYLEKDDILYGYTLDELIKVTYNNGNPLPEFNVAAQVWNHDFFWESMQPGGGNLPILGLLQQIEKDFGSFSNFREEFIETALTLFGSGWVWLVLKRNEKRLAIATTTNAVTPLVWDDIPLLSLDMWEHAYYLDYKVLSIRKTLLTTANCFFYDGDIDGFIPQMDQFFFLNKSNGLKLID